MIWQNDGFYTDYKKRPMWKKTVGNDNSNAQS